MLSGSITNLYQSQLIQLCLNLFLPSGELLKAPTTNLVQFLNNAPIQELDFNSEVKGASYKEIKTPLSFIVDAALNGLSDPLKIILKKVNNSKLDFNINCQNGTLLRRVAMAAFYGKNLEALEMILDASPIKKLNWDANAPLGNNYNNVLHWIILIAAQGNMKPLKIILSKPDLSCIDFNAKSIDGKTPLWWLAFFLTKKQLDSDTVEKVLVNLDILQLDFNVKTKESISVLSLLSEASAQGHVKPLQMILKKEVISKFSFDEEEGKGILLGLILTAFNGYSKPLKIFLSTKFASHWHIDNEVKEELLHKTQENIYEILIKMIVNKRSILKLNEVVSACISMGHTNVALTYIQAGACEKMFTLPLIDAITNGHHDTVQKIFPYYELYGFQILTKENKSHFDSITKIKQFLFNPYTYLDSHGLTSQKIWNHFQSKLIEFCENLFSSDGKFDEDVTNILYFFLKEIPLHQFDFNRKLEKGPFKGNTLFWVIALAAYKGNLFFLKMILDKLNEKEVSKLNFNANPPDGKYAGRTPLWLIAKLASFSNNSDWSKVILYIFSVMLNKVDISKFDFNAKAQRGHAQGQTVLLLLARTKELSLILLDVILAKNRMAYFDFYAKEKIGGTTPFWWFAHSAAEHKNPIPLQLLLDNSDISVSHLNAKSNSNTTVFHLVVQAAAHRMVGPLETILKKVPIKDLDFDSKPSLRTSIPFLLVLVAMGGYAVLIRKILLQRSLDSRWFDEHTNKILFEKSQDEISTFFINKIENKIKNKIINKDEMLLESLICFGHTKVALACLEAGGDINAVNTALYDAGINGYQETVKEIFPYYELYGVPISKIINDKWFFTPHNISQFLKSDDQLSLIKPFCSKLHYICLNLLALDNDVKDYESNMLIEDDATQIENMDSSHTKELLIDYFKDQILYVFENKLNSFQTLEEKRTLYRALTELTGNNAKSVIMDPNRYKQEWIALREKFIKEVETVTENKTLEIPLAEDDYIFIEQIFADIAGHNKIYDALSKCFNTHLDKVPTAKDFEPQFITNPFDKEVFDIFNAKDNVNHWQMLMTFVCRQDRFNRYCPRVQEVFRGCNAMPAEFLSHFTKAVVLFVDLYERWDFEIFKADFLEGKLGALNEPDNYFLKTNLNLLDRLEKLESMNFGEVKAKKNTYTPSFISSDKDDNKTRHVIYPYKIVSKDSFKL